MNINWDEYIKELFLQLHNGEINQNDFSKILLNYIKECEININFLVGSNEILRESIKILRKENEEINKNNIGD